MALIQQKYGVVNKNSMCIWKGSPGYYKGSQAASQGSSRGLELGKFGEVEGMCLWIQNIIKNGINRKREVLMGVEFSSNQMGLRVGSIVSKLKTNRNMLYGLEHVTNLSVPWSSHQHHEKTEYVH